MFKKIPTVFVKAPLEYINRRELTLYPTGSVLNTHSENVIPAPCVRALAEHNWQIAQWDLRAYHRVLHESQLYGTPCDATKVHFCLGAIPPHPECDTVYASS